MAEALKTFFSPALVRRLAAELAVSGNWTDAQLNGHGPFVRDRMRE